MYKSSERGDVMKSYRGWFFLVLVVALVVGFDLPGSAMSMRDTLRTHGAGSGSGSATQAAADNEGVGQEGTVEVSSSLNIRTSPWGQIIGKFKNGDKVRIVGREGAWLKINYNGQTAFVHSRYVTIGEVSAGAQDRRGNDTAPSIDTGNAGPVQQRIVAKAREYLTRYGSRGSFPYAPGTENGNLGCANVVTKCLKDAGVINWINLGVYPTADRLKREGWKKVRPPPFQAGDVVIWGPPPGGRHGHIGIAMSNGNNVQVMNNSSSQRKPILSSAMNRAVDYVMRKA